MTAGRVSAPEVAPRRRPLTPAEIAALDVLVAEAEVHDGVAPLSEEHLLALRGAQPCAFTVQDGASLVALGTHVASSGELVVAPEHRRRGLGRELVRALLADGVPALWAHGDLPAARALAASEDLRPVRELLRLELTLPSAASHEALAQEIALDADVARDRLESEGLAMRSRVEVGESFDAQWLELNALAFAHHPEQGRWSLADVRARTAEEWFDPSLWWIVYDGAAPVASLWLKPGPLTQEAAPRRAELYVLAVRPDHAGAGLGGALTALAVRELCKRGYGVVELYVDGGNAAARRVYERASFTVVDRDVQYAPAHAAQPEPEQAAQPAPAAPA